MQWTLACRERRRDERRPTGTRNSREFRVCIQQAFPTGKRTEKTDFSIQNILFRVPFPTKNASCMRPLVSLFRDFPAKRTRKFRALSLCRFRAIHHAKRVTAIRRDESGFGVWYVLRTEESQSKTDLPRPRHARTAPGAADDLET